jgi:DNA-binding transcriptional MocR family regulator
MRLNFSYSTNEQLDVGMQRLGTVIERKMKVLCR